MDRAKIFQKCPSPPFPIINGCMGRGKIVFHWRGDVITAISAVCNFLDKYVFPWYTLRCGNNFHSWCIVFVPPSSSHLPAIFSLVTMPAYHVLCVSPMVPWCLRTCTTVQHGAVVVKFLARFFRAYGAYDVGQVFGCWRAYPGYAFFGRTFHPWRSWESFWERVEEGGSRY